MMVLNKRDQLIPMGFWLMNPKCWMNSRYDRVGFIEELAERWQKTGSPGGRAEKPKRRIVV